MCMHILSFKIVEILHKILNLTCDFILKYNFKSYYLIFTCACDTQYTYYKQQRTIIVFSIQKTIYKSLKIYDYKNKQET